MNDILIGIIVSVFGIGLLFVTRKIGSGGIAGKFDVLTSHFFPSIIAIFLILLGIIFLSSAINRFRKNKSITKEPEHDNQIENSRVFKVVLCVIAYVFLISLLGFVLATVIITGLLMYLFGEKRWGFIVFMSIISSIVIYYSFLKFFYIYLPNDIFFMQ